MVEMVAEVDSLCSKFTFYFREPVVTGDIAVNSPNREARMLADLTNSPAVLTCQIPSRTFGELSGPQQKGSKRTRLFSSQ
jgi:hypothetical protein